MKKKDRDFSLTGKKVFLEGSVCPAKLRNGGKGMEEKMTHSSL